MSMAVSDEVFDMGIAMCHDRLVEALKAYKDFLYVFGTVPDMSLADEIGRSIDKILSHDRSGCESVLAFRTHATDEEVSQ